MKWKGIHKASVKFDKYFFSNVLKENESVLKVSLKYVILVWKSLFHHYTCICGWYLEWGWKKLLNEMCLCVCTCADCMFRIRVGVIYKFWTCIRLKMGWISGLFLSALLVMELLVSCESGSFLYESSFSKGIRLFCYF